MCSAAPPSVIRSHVQHRTGHSYMLSSPAPAVRWFIIALKFSQQSARHFFTRPQFRPTRNVGEWEQSHSRAAPATAELFSCTVQTRPRAAGSRAAAKNWLELFDILHRAATAAVNPLLLLSSLASFAFYTGRSFAQFFLVSGLPLCPLCRGVNELSGKFCTIIISSIST